MPTKKPASTKKATPAAVKKSVPIKKASPAKKVPPRKATVARTDVFISYSQRDKAWMERLKTHLKPLERTNLNVWVDTKLRAGDKWRVEIEKALAQTKVAILLISPNFLASDFIDTNELPPLLKAAEKEGTTILPLLLSTSMFPLTALSEFQAINGPEHPLDLLSDGQINQTLFQVAKRVHEIFMAPAKKPEVKSVASVKKASATSTEQLDAAVKKIAASSSSKSASRPASPKSPAASISATQQALLVRRSGEWEVIPVHQAKIGKQLEMALLPATSSQVAFLTTLRQSSRDGLASLVFRGHSYRCTQQDLHAVTENNRETWHLTADMQELLAHTEVTYSNLTPDMQAQVRAELLLLNSQPPEQSPMRWLSNSGFTDLTASPLPALFQQVRSSPARFKQVAPLVITWFLHFTNTVQHIKRLILTLKGRNLVIDFEGQRDAVHREAPIIIRVKGNCSLGGATENAVLLGPVRSY
ncbi:toll/interleukin-1 receptor domain-containing protein [Hymenobacter psoromatis]|uniref:toll/interleukin-1 receptor domain-containing protein n=1 Tax=Hymenobacter psoromatis TaxID=1484116 RepID=UPI001CC0E5A2|nr:toll/interleukin-1 receptor domain-containing protein [Hymenobacter psoromatis]